jgi:hypothetical protein
MKLHQGKVEYLDKNNKTTFRLSFPFDSWYARLYFLKSL